VDYEKTITLDLGTKTKVKSLEPGDEVTCVVKGVVQSVHRAADGSSVTLSNPSYTVKATTDAESASDLIKDRKRKVVQASQEDE
jgi:hypothetical protein